MKLFLLIGIFFFSGLYSTTIANGALQDKKYPVAVSFGSMCCGTATDEFLKSFVEKFNKQNHVKISADKAAGCGREGEFVILFILPKSKKLIENKFINQLGITVKTQDERNKKLNKTSGGMELIFKINSSQYGHCRLGFTKWI
jgi:hypothetical protein